MLDRNIFILDGPQLNFVVDNMWLKSSIWLKLANNQSLLFDSNIKTLSCHLPGMNQSSVELKLRFI